MFNVDVAEDRRTYLITEEKKVHFYNCGRYGAVSFAIRTDALKNRVSVFLPCSAEAPNTATVRTVCLSRN